jgi:hypothetical protein
MCRNNYSIFRFPSTKERAVFVFIYKLHYDMTTALMTYHITDSA